MNARVYLDYAATTPVDKRVVESMLPYFQEVFGNTSSLHFHGQQAESALERSRAAIAQGLNCRPEEVIFTACGSESDNLALRGAAFAALKNRNANHILISPVEHHAVSNTAQQLADVHGFDLEYLPVDQYGLVNPQSLIDRLRPTTAVVSVIYANNEIGTINFISEIGSICRKHNIPFLTDAVQAAAYLPVDVDELNVDLMALGAHKFYGPKGIGVLYVRKGTPILSTLTGGGQEFGLRGGTHNTAYIVGMAEAFHLAVSERLSRLAWLLPLRDRIIDFVLHHIPNCQLTGHPIHRMPNHASFVFLNVNGNQLLMMLDVKGFSCSSGSACKTGNPEPSDVLLAIGYDKSWALGSLRVTLGTSTTDEEVDRFLDELPTTISKLRELNTESPSLP